MAISKVVYGQSVLMDLTSDTVDAAHLAKGYTAHDAGGNLIVGGLEQQGSNNLLSGVTPRLLNGVTQSGKTYVIPSGIEFGTELIEYQLDIPALKPDEVYCVLVYGKTQSKYRSLFASLYSGSNKYYGSSRRMLGTNFSVEASSYEITPGEKPTKLVFESSSDGEQLSIFNITLMALDV